jgi:hypothetical protein
MRVDGRVAKFSAAKRQLTESGYAGQPITCLVARDLPFLKAWGAEVRFSVRPLRMANFFGKPRSPDRQRSTGRRFARFDRGLAREKLRLRLARSADMAHRPRRWPPCC